MKDYKDYVDLYFILKKHYSIADISREASTMFGQLYSEKLFRAQLSYFEDIDYTENVDYRIENPPSDEEIRNQLIEIAIEEL